MMQLSSKAIVFQDQKLKEILTLNNEHASKAIFKVLDP